MTATPNPDVRATAFHEAGHAVVARHLGIGVRKVTIEATSDDAHGTTFYMGRPMSDERLRAPDARTRGRLERLVVAAWAGPLAEERATGSWNAKNSGSLPAFEHADAGNVSVPPEGTDLRGIVDAVTVLHDGLDCRKAGTPVLGRTAGAYIEYLRLRALDLVEDLWGHIEAVAAALAEHRTLSGRRFRAVCQVVDDALCERRGTES